ncbi:uncharacterized protein LOC143187268 [Calliopsis andreniformis]|uniref:uncharacterized protein LOC143187268 n=1 Tax=Calliopsis andreniformis TaxID=337506 RepID=UPI003FCED364
MQLQQLLVLYFLINTILNCANGINIRKNYDKLREKLNKLLHRQKESKLLLDIDEFEYPRANETLRKIHRQLWEDYYQCLKKSYSEMGIEKAIYPINLVALEGTFVTLNCQICISPTESHTTDNIEWYFNSSTNNEMNKLIEESDNVLISPDDKRLMIYNVKANQAGQYWCKLGDTLSTIIHYLSIDSDIKEVKTVYPRTAPNMPHATKERILPEYNLIVHTTWTKWSPCSKCNAVGKKNRYGYCTLSSQENPKKHLRNYKRQSEETESTTESEHSEAEDTVEKEQTGVIEATTEGKSLNETAKNKIKMALNIFRNSLPCKSKYLPKEILNHPDVISRKTEMMIRYCKIKCSENVIFEVRDKQGRILESANNSAGIYSMVQGIPIPSPPVIRTVVYEKYKKKGTLACPGNLNTDVPITWKVDNKVLNPSIIKEQSRDRIYINPQMQIIFTSLKFEDSNIYSCWQKNDIAGVIRLNVVGEIEVQTNYTIIMTGGSLIIIVFLIIFWKAFKGRRRFTIH